MNQNIKSLSIAAFALVGMLACVKEIPQETSPQETPGVTVTLSTTVNLPEDTKALTPEGVKTFAVGDQIAVVYKNTSGNTVKVDSEALKSTDITGGGTSATFTVTLENPDRTQDVTYIYPAAMAKDNGDPNLEALASQDGTLETLAQNLDYACFTGAWNAGALPTATLQNQLAILAITLKSSDGASVINNEISRLTLFAGTQSYVVTRTPAEGTIYIAIQPTSGTNIQLVAQSAARYYTKSLTDKTYAANNGYPVAFRMAALPEGALPGKFTVASGTQVYFSWGNLQLTAADTWQFAANQWDFFGNSQTDNHRDLFGWGTGTNPNQTSTNASDYGIFNDWGANAITNGGNTANNGWYTISNDQWMYLFVTRSGSTTSGTPNARYTFATINTDGTGVNGIILFPDGMTFAAGEATWGTINDPSNWSSRCTTTQWMALEAKGCVFLPATGYRDGGSLHSVGGGANYWSSTEEVSSNAKVVCFWSSTLLLDNDCSRTYGNTVRLVKNTAPVTGISLNKTALTIPVGSIETLTATVTPSTAANSDVSWTSSNPTVATVNAATGAITAVAKGPATITATALDGSGITATCAVTVIPEGALPGKFTVASGKQVYFSKGNLQAKTEDGGSNWSWDFAEHQWDYIGNNTANNKITGNGTVSANGTVDLYGWSTASTTFGIHNSQDNATYSGSFNDWGVNAISNGGNTANSGWYTLSKDEWTWLIGPSNSPNPGTNCRTSSTVNGTANARFCKAYLFGTTHGLILFPDDYTHPEGVTAPTGINATDVTSWNANQYDAASWAKMETAGAVFLPAAGGRMGATCNNPGTAASFFTSTNFGNNCAYRFAFDASSMTILGDGKGRLDGRSVRLVRPVE
jgi:hypothetical protein